LKKGNSSTPELGIEFLILSPDGMKPQGINTRNKKSVKNFCEFFCLRGECGKILKFKAIIWGVLAHDEGLGLRAEGNGIIK